MWRLPQCRRPTSDGFGRTSTGRRDGWPWVFKSPLDSSERRNLVQPHLFCLFSPITPGYLRRREGCIVRSMRRSAERIHMAEDGDICGEGGHLLSQSRYLIQTRCGGVGTPCARAEHSRFREGLGQAMEEVSKESGKEENGVPS